MSLSRRVVRYVENKCPPSDQELILDLLAVLQKSLAGYGEETQERVVAAALVVSQGKLNELAIAMADAFVDFRDLLMDTPFAQKDWPDQLDRIFGVE